VTKEIVNISSPERWSIGRLQCKFCDSLLSANNPLISATHNVKQEGPDGKRLYECLKDKKARKALTEHIDATPCEVSSSGPSCAKTSGMGNASSSHSIALQSGEFLWHSMCGTPCRFGRDHTYKQNIMAVMHVGSGSKPLTAYMAPQATQEALTERMAAWLILRMTSFAKPDHAAIAKAALTGVMPPIASRSQKLTCRHLSETH
jgi:hypothetical protein